MLLSISTDPPSVSLSLSLPGLFKLLWFLVEANEAQGEECITGSEGGGRGVLCPARLLSVLHPLGQGLDS